MAGDNPSDGPCVCGGSAPWDRCCGPILAGTAEAPTAEALMRARYSAHATGNEGYIRRSWHPDTCPPKVMEPSLRWLGLEIRGTTGGRALDRTGTVTFAARYEKAGQPAVLVERSHFVRDGIRWLYHDGDPLRA